MSDTQVYGASRIKRVRATKIQMDERRAALLTILSEIQPATVRQVFYQATVRGVVQKDERGYARVQRELADMRREGVLPYDWVVDSTRWMRKPVTHNSLAALLENTARTYRRDMWVDADHYVEVWVEKDALAGVIYPVTAQFDVPLMVSRGFASLSYLYEAGSYIEENRKPAIICHLGDYDPSGVAAADSIEAGLRHHAPNADITFERLAVTPAQIDMWNLPTRPTKVSDRRARGFGAHSVELDAIEPARLRDLVRSAIERFVPAERMLALKTAEESERQLLRIFSRQAAAESGEE